VYMDNAGLLKKEQLKARNEKIMQGWLHRWVSNTATNYGSKLLGEEENFANLFMAHKNKPALITGSGPSLEDTIPHIKNFDGLVISTNSSMSLLMKNGIKPDYVHIFDGQYKPERIGNLPIDDVTLICATFVLPEMVKFWKTKGKVYGFSAFDPEEVWFKKYMWYLYRDYVGIPTSGSVGPNAIRLAAYMGCNPIILTGLDQTFTGGKYRVDQYDYIDDKYVLKDFDHEEAINKQPISYHNGQQLWYITGMMYRTAIVGIADELRDKGLSVVRCHNQGDPNFYKVEGVLLKETKGIEVKNATMGGVWKNELPRYDLVA